MATDHSEKSGKKDHRVLLKKSSKSLTSLVLELIRPYNKWLLVIFLAMLLETAMSLLGPWPLKIIIDNVVGHHPLPGVASLDQGFAI